ncbi:hypothetical protein [Martelella soudanensis]|uniref:hypothetical protein n=1 Tax=unclassified Martelella TaxID=2629616 RepID=UPI0015DFDA4A|nr:MULTISPECIES: hypothetical protein [unclassified Martelella]
MSFRNTRRVAAVLAISGLAACSTSTPEPEPATARPVTPGINLTALTKLCPKVILDDEVAFKRIYSPANAETPENLVYQVSLGEFSRTCAAAPTGDKLLEQISIAGRLVGGPKARSGTYQVPVRVEVVDGDVAVYEQVINQEITMPAEGMSTQFLFRADDLPVPLTAGPNTAVRVGIAR